MSSAREVPKTYIYAQEHKFHLLLRAQQLFLALGALVRPGLNF